MSKIETPMDADRYNRRVLIQGGVRPSYLTLLTRDFQKSVGLHPDGKFGPMTIDAVRMRRADTSLSHRALLIAKWELGHGETISNNRGPDVYRYRQGDGTGLPWDNANPWCASFISYCFMRSAYLGEVQLPFKTSRNAKRLTDQICEAGGRLLVPTEGAVICWHRGILPRQGHIGLCLKYDAGTGTLVTIEGNRRKKGRLSKVTQYKYENFIWKERLYAIGAL